MQRSPYGIKMKSLGSALPTKIITNEDLGLLMDTNDEWIKSRTGISERRICTGNEDGLELSVIAANKALGDTDPNELDLIIVATSTPDFLYPSMACRLQERLGAKRAFGFDLSAACSGFVYGLVNAYQFIRSGDVKRVILVGVDIHSRFIDWQDRSTAILFGDGAGAVLLESCSSEENELLAYSLHSDGSGACDLTLPNAGAAFPQSQASIEAPKVQMNGRKIYQFAVSTIPLSVEETAQKAGLTSKDVDYLVCHQANQRIIESVAGKMGLPLDRCLSNLASVGNTSAASIPLVLDQYFSLIPAASVLALTGFGAGLTWGTVLWRKA